MNVREIKVNLAELEREVLRGEERYKTAAAQLEDAQKGLIVAGIDPEGDIEAQVKTLEIAAERSQALALDLFRKLQVKLVA